MVTQSLSVCRLFGLRFWFLVLDCRDFVSSGYAQLKRENPKLPILVRECSGVQPRLWVRYGKRDETQIRVTENFVYFYFFVLSEMGKEKSVTLTNAGAADVAKHIAELGK